MTATIGCIVLAAGSSRRFGSDKRQAGFGTGKLLQAVLDSIPASFSQRLLVLSPRDARLKADFEAAWPVVMAADADRGMGYSLAAALDLATGWDGAVIALGDMPWVQASTYTTLQSRLRPDCLVVPTWQGRRGNPVGIGCHYFTRLTRASGDAGARVLFSAADVQVDTVPVDDPGILRDVDVPADLAADLAADPPADLAQPPSDTGADPGAS